VVRPYLLRDRVSFRDGLPLWDRSSVASVPFAGDR